jgi:hypothetical protein
MLAVRSVNFIVGLKKVYYISKVGSVKEMNKTGCVNRYERMMVCRFFKHDSIILLVECRYKRDDLQDLPPQITLRQRVVRATRVYVERDLVYRPICQDDPDQRIIPTSITQSFRRNDRNT